MRETQREKEGTKIRKIRSTGKDAEKGLERSGISRKTTINGD